MPHKPPVHECSPHAAHCDVLIVGCGPVGAVLANLLGRLGVHVVVLERDDDVYPVPRATHIDEETLRNFQATGLIDDLLPYTDRFGRLEVVSRHGTVLFNVDVEDPNTPHGYQGSRFFDQPAFERILRKGLARYPRVRLETGVEAVDLADDGTHVVLRAVRTPTGESIEFSADWLVGCDGGRSLARTALGIDATSLATRRQWLIVDSLLLDPADRRFLPDSFRYVLGSDRLAIYAHGAGMNRRWEFQLHDGEARPDDAKVVEWVSRFVDPARIRITRIGTYWHNAMVAERWRVGRILLAGDAAHMMPPMAGQGMCSGIRDAINLAWKLHAVVDGSAADTLLDTYAEERVPHLREVLAGTLGIGRTLEDDTRFKRLRRTVLFTMTRVPGVKALLRRLFLRWPPLKAGVLARGAKCAGYPIPQTSIERDGQVVRLDDVLGYRFALVARRGLVSSRIAARAKQCDVGVWELDVGLRDVDGRLEAWMRKHDLDFVLVRPDRYIFGTGRASQLEQTLDELATWFQMDHLPGP